MPTTLWRDNICPECGLHEVDCLCYVMPDLPYRKDDVETQCDICLAPVTDHCQVCGVPLCKRHHETGAGVCNRH